MPNSTIYTPDFMTENNLITDPHPLKTQYIPKNLIDREEQKAAITSTFSNKTDSTYRNLYLHGSRGTGKTLSIKKKLKEIPDTTQTCYIPCQKYSTQYQALKEILKSVSNKDVKVGHHTSRLQREIENKTSAMSTVIVLDEVDFLLQKDGGSLLYYLSRIENSEKTSIVVISSNHSDPKSVLEERTYSSLHPQIINFEPYTGKQIFQILKQRAEKSLKPQTLRKEALTYIASSTQNASIALNWLKIVAEQATEIITENLVKETKEKAYQRYADQKLENFTDHHELLYQAVRELTEEKESSVIRTGEIYERYQELCENYNQEKLSNRRLSDYLKHLELLNLIQANYHYGGKEGKTRDIQLMRI